VDKQLELQDWIPADEEDKTAPVRQLEEWTGINKEMLPPETMLDDQQLHQLLEALKKMLEVYNCSFVLQTQVPERIQYATIRDNFDQQVKIKRWHMGFFELCRQGTKHKECALGEYCQCAFYADLFFGFIDEELTPDEERARELEIEINHLKRKYGNQWIKYYPYHLNASYDDENGNLYDYGLGEEEDDEDDDDNWWRK
jgi:hypothetical protein